MIILLPMPVFLTSQLPTRKKVMLCGIFALGTFTVSQTSDNCFLALSQE